MKTHSFDLQHIDKDSNWTVTTITLMQCQKQCKTLQEETKSIYS